jgi:peptide/nickel transport system ATP-binding protein/oligopeptide transport system ATP-binding protein
VGEEILQVMDLKTVFYSDGEEIPAVDGISFSLRKGETLGIVGESGSGKSVTSLSIMRLIPSPPGKIVDGSILFKGQDLLKKSDEEMRRIRGNNISMIFQEPMTSLNPVYTIGRQISETIMLHQNLSKKEAMNKAVEMLQLVKIPLPGKRIKQYPHQLSGGMRQRVMIAMALSCRPELLIADEPTTALDVTIQAQILEILKDMRDKTGTAVILITHDLGVVAEIADNVLVMYCGRAVEYSSVRNIFFNPKHPYTIGLLNSIPKIEGPRKKLQTIKGVVPSPNQITKGCRFKTRCDFVRERCMDEEPPLIRVGNSLVRCWRYYGGGNNCER